MYNDDNRSMSTADCLVRWFRLFRNDIKIESEQIQCLTLNPNLDEIWREIISHYHPRDFVKKVKETLKIHDLKQRHPDRWEQHKNVQFQQNQIEQRIHFRLKEISTIRCDQSTNILNEFHRLKIMIDDERNQIISFNNQLHFYRQIQIHLNKLSKFKDQLQLFIGQSGSNQQKIHQDLLMNINSSFDKYLSTTNINEICSQMNLFIQQRTHQLSQIEKDCDDRHISVIDVYEDSLNKINLDFSKQFIHLSNIRLESLKIRDRLEETKREVLSKRSSQDQTQLSSILDAMIFSKSVDVHLSLLKKKLQTEIEQTKRFDENQVSRLHQQINEKRNELNRIDQQLNRIVQENPLDKLEKIESKFRDYLQLLNDLPKRFHSLNLNHLSLSNELRSNIFNWTIEQFKCLTPNYDLNEISIDSSQSNSSLSTTLESPVTPLKSLKQLLGIRTQDNQITEMNSNNENLFKNERQNWQLELIEDETSNMKFPRISSINWELLTQVDQQIEQRLKQSEQDFIEYHQGFQTIFKEIETLHFESRKSSIFLR